MYKKHYMPLKKYSFCSSKINFIKIILLIYTVHGIYRIHIYTVDSNVLSLDFLSHGKVDLVG